MNSVGSVSPNLPLPLTLCCLCSVSVLSALLIIATVAQKAGKKHSYWIFSLEDGWRFILFLKKFSIFVVL